MTLYTCTCSTGARAQLKTDVDVMHNTFTQELHIIHVHVYTLYREESPVYNLCVPTITLDNTHVRSVPWGLYYHSTILL